MIYVLLNQVYIDLMVSVLGFANMLVELLGLYFKSIDIANFEIVLSPAYVVLGK